MLQREEVLVPPVSGVVLSAEAAVQPFVEPALVYLELAGNPLVLGSVRAGEAAVAHAFEGVVPVDLVVVEELVGGEAVLAELVEAREFLGLVLVLVLPDSAAVVDPAGLGPVLAAAEERAPDHRSRRPVPLHPDFDGYQTPDTADYPRHDRKRSRIDVCSGYTVLAVSCRALDCREADLPSCGYIQRASRPSYRSRHMSASPVLQPFVEGAAYPHQLPSDIPSDDLCPGIPRMCDDHTQSTEHAGSGQQSEPAQGR